ncbi:MAG: phosphate butyryltransferase [Calditrichaeota bacterium]|nr:phosphate butyryltransferase [Calditrichota bacterium]
MPKKISLPHLTTMEAILERAREISGSGEPHKVAVAAAHDDAAIEAAVKAQEAGIAQSMLFGDSAKIGALIEQHNSRPAEFNIIHTADDDESAERCAMAVAIGQADIIMKGILPTSKLLKSVLRQKYGLRRKGLLAHTAILSPKLYPKLLGVTDGGMVIKPTFEQKIDIIRNAVLVGWALGIERPRVAMLATVDYVVQAFPETFEAAALSKMAQREQIKQCYIDGPMSFDTAVWPQAVEYQNIKSDVAGNADIVVANSIEEGNILAKSLIQFGGASFAGVILGAKAPISLVSRADPAFNKLASIALAVVVSHFLKKG